ncbi:hypothetical protein NLJ89_g10592 [Agrocybe chaxingu]|uniref:Uncharacterized protein n=1 Tax=Agrocybe chaxingu TaxID=84603 RepID=A0A9W8JQU8_9AGAR|nr:hypothetical protein NLJ89_g10592 [Agrocybe chaxingu]
MATTDGMQDMDFLAIYGFDDGQGHQEGLQTGPEHPQMSTLGSNNPFIPFTLRTTPVTSHPPHVTPASPLPLRGNLRPFPVPFAYSQPQPPPSVPAPNPFYFGYTPSFSAPFPPSYHPPYSSLYPPQPAPYQYPYYSGYPPVSGFHHPFHPFPQQQPLQPPIEDCPQTPIAPHAPQFPLHLMPLSFLLPLLLYADVPIPLLLHLALLLLVLLAHPTVPLQLLLILFVVLPILILAPLQYDAAATPLLIPAPVSSSSTSTFSLPNLSTLRLLDSEKDFPFWSEDVRHVLAAQDLLSHIIDPAEDFDRDRLSLRPSYPPVLPANPSHADYVTYDAWWKEDSRAQHILTARLSSAARLFLVHLDATPTRRTARAIYTTLVEAFAQKDRLLNMHLCDALLKATCQPGRVKEYVGQWRQGLSQLRASSYSIPAALLMRSFVSHVC